MSRTLALLAALPMAALPIAGLAEQPAPSESQLAVYQALSGRHFEAGCGSLQALSKTLADDLVWLAENTHQPAWVAVRAADCVLALEPATADAAARRWMGSADFKGLALVTVQHLDAMPLEQSSALVQVGLAGPLGETLRPRLSRLSTPQLKAMATP